MKRLEDSSSEQQRLLLAKTPLDPIAKIDVATPRVPCLTILWHRDPVRVGERIVLRELATRRRVALSRTAPLFAAPDGGRRHPLAEVYLSRRPLWLSAEPDGGARLDRDAAPTRVLIDGESLAETFRIGAERLEQGVVLLLAERVVLLLHAVSALPAPQLQPHGLIGESAAMVSVRVEIERVKDLPVPVLLRGETGTGKELVARAIHEGGTRRNGPYVPVNMAAIPSSLAASELFGAAQGAYTGATRRQRGYFERAEGGSLFLDEIGEMPIEVQALLLRTLESGEIQPVGSAETRAADVRILTATDRDLESAVDDDRFRAPLLHRLGGYEITLPPLRARRDDLGRLLVHFLAQELKAVDAAHRLDEPPAQHEPWLPAPLVARLAASPWPGNVRQLRNLARRLVIQNAAQAHVQIDNTLERLLHTETTPPEIVQQPTVATPQPTYRKATEIDEEQLRTALRANRWRIKPTAAHLGLSRGALYMLIERTAGIRKASDLSREEIECCATRCCGDIDAMVEALEVSRYGLKQRMKALDVER